MTAYIVVFDGKAYYGSWMKNIYDMVFRREPMKINHEYTAGGVTFFLTPSQIKNEILVLRKRESNVHCDMSFNLGKTGLFISGDLWTGENYGFRRYGNHVEDMTCNANAIKNRFKEYEGDYIPHNRGQDVGKRPWAPCIIKQKTEADFNRNFEIVKRVRLNYSVEAIMAELNVDESTISNLWRLHVAY